MAFSALTAQVPIHNFMVDDLMGSLIAVGLFPLFVLVPGYAIAWLLGLFEFRRRTNAFRIALSIPLSIAICPIVTYLTGRFGSMNAVWAFYAAAAICFLTVAARQLRKGIPRGFGIRKEMRIFVVISVAWLAVALFSLIDIQIGDRLYYPVSALDSSIRVEFIHSIGATGIPPQNPFYLAGPPANLRYHYFWLMMCSLVERAGMGAVTPRQALIGGTFWCGIALMALVALYLRLFAAGDPARFRRRALTGILLLGITGLDIIPTLLLVFLYARGLMGFVLPSVEWWNEHVDWFVYSTLWAPHALASMLACFTGFLLLWKAGAATRWSGVLRYSPLAALALASSIGASIYVSFVFASFLMVWTVVTVWKKWRWETAALVSAGFGCIALILPYLKDLQGPASGGAPLQFTVRAFSLADMIPVWHGLTPGWRLILVNGPLIPLNYLMELGFFFLAGLVTLRKFRKRGGSLSREELACAVMAAVSILICTFLRSSVIGCNDLGWRGFLIAEFVLLLWAVDVLADAKLPISERRLLTVCIVLGVSGTIYDLAITRFYPVLADSGVMPPLDWMSPDRQFGKRTYASRYAYRWARAQVSPTAAIQFNPKVVFQDTPAMLYSDRRFVASDMGCNASFGGDPALCAPVASRLRNFYAAGGDSATKDICQSIPVQLLIAKDTDPVWADDNSWVWTETPIFANRFIRLFGCPRAASNAIAGVIIPGGPTP